MLKHLKALETRILKVGLTWKCGHDAICFIIWCVVKDLQLDWAPWWWCLKTSKRLGKVT